MARAISWTDRLIDACDQGLKTVLGSPQAQRPSPAAATADAPLTPAERKLSAKLMRVNRAGEISAQALYVGQSLLARDPATAAQLRRAAAEEIDHLAWCNQRINELGGRHSWLDPFWYLGSACIGLIAGLGGDAASLGFVTETEKQVEAHIQDHLRRLPAADSKSRAVLEQMSADEVRHGREAIAAGGAAVPEPARRVMAIGGSILRQLAFRL